MQRLVAGGFIPSDITLHKGIATSDYETAIGLDETLTGGIVGNFESLLRGLFHSKLGSATEALTYAEAVRTEGVIVQVNLISVDEADRAIRILSDSGAVRVARLPQAGLES